MNITDSFIKTYTDKPYKYTTTVRHQGTVIALAMDHQRRIYYTVLDLQQSQAADSNALDVNLWLENPQRLAFPQEIVQVGFGLADPTPMPVVKQGDRQPSPNPKALKPEELDRFLSSTARLSADAPFQVISDGKYVCLWRQAIAATEPDQVFVSQTTPVVNSTLLLDRFVLVGNTLEVKREVRYQRSRNQTRPQSDKDSLNALDMEGTPFIEPTQELAFVQNLSGGRFAVIVLPTQIAAIKRWQLFADNPKAQCIDTYNLEQSPDGLFNTEGSVMSEIRAAAESALNFNGAGFALIDKPQLPVGNTAYTIETWVQGQGPIISWGKDAGNTLQVTATGLVNTVSGQALTAPTAYDRTAWHHIAATFDGTTRILYLNGIEIGRDQPIGLNIVASATAKIGTIDGQTCFSGTIDEIRVWDRARSGFELLEGLPYRLVGNEPGLAAYWRFDEAGGMQIFDQTDAAQQGTLQGQPQWVKSDAPIQDDAKINHDRFQIAGRPVTSGLSALLYYQQEPAIGGYDQASKPFKQNARVMLAMTTQATSGSEISILDFAVSKAGKLAQIPDRINLPQLVMQGANAQVQMSIAARQGKIAQLKLGIQTLETSLKSLSVPTATFYAGFGFRGNSFTLTAGETSGFRGLAFINSIRLSPGAVVTLTGGQRVTFTDTQSGDVNSDLSGLFNGVKVDESAANRQRRDSLQQQLDQVRQDLQNQEALLAGELNRAQGEQSVPMKLLNIDPDGLTLAGGILQNFFAKDTPYLFDSATGQVALYYRGLDDQFRAAYYDTLTARAKFAIAAHESKVVCSARSSEAELDRLTLTISGDDPETCTVTIGGTESIREVWHQVPRQPAQFAAVLNGTMTAAVHVASLANALRVGPIQALPVVSGLTRSLQAGDRLQVGTVMFTVAQSVDRATTTIPVLEMTLAETIAEASDIVLVEYDYNNAASNQLLADLRRGSSLICVVEATGTDAVKNGTFGQTQSTQNCRWIGAAPGNTLVLKGGEYGKLSDAQQLQQLAAQRDLTLETWVKPDVMTTRGRLLHHRTGNQSEYSLGVEPITAATPAAGYTVFASVGTQTVRAKLTLPWNEWKHVAVTFRQGYAVQLDGKTGCLNGGNRPTLDLNRDLTIEAALKLDPTGSHGILTKGRVNDGTDQTVPYAFYVSNGTLVFAFETTDGQLREFRSNPNLPLGQFAQVAVTRKHTAQVASDTGAISEWYDIWFYCNGQPVGKQKYVITATTKAAGSTDQPLEIGKTYLANGTPLFCRGTLSEVRLWNVARSEAAIGGKLTGNESGLVSWWRFSEADGNLVGDAKSDNHAKLTAGCAWVKTPDPNGSSLMLYSEGLPVPTEPIALPPTHTDQFTIGTLLNGNQPQEAFKGIFKDFRIWRTVRSQAQIQDNLFTPLLGEQADLLAYYDCNANSETEVLDQSGHRNHLTFWKANQSIVPPYAISKAPISLDTPQIQSTLSDVKTVYHDVLHSQPGVQEYGDLQLDAAGNLVGVLKRCYSVIKNNQWQLITGFKVGNLVTEWIGQVQSDPQLIGFIEGAPPVPSENLTLKEDYTAASAVELVEAQSTTYTYASSRDKGFDMAISGSATLGVKSQTTVGLGVETSMEDTDIKIGVQTSFENSLGWLEDVSSGSGRTTTKASKMALQGNAIDGRFVPRNVGFALVQSETADVFALRLQHNNALVSYQMRPNPDIPRDWNILTFPLNASYTKQGTLDGKVGLTVDADYPSAMQYGSDRSYFKPIEAYSLKHRIQREQEQLKAEFDQFDAGGLGRRQSVTQFSAGDVATGRSRDKLPQLHKRNLVNTYVWTADGGLFAESEETLDVQQETMGGSYAFKGMAGLTVSAEVALSKVALGFELQALFGGHLNLTVTKSSESETAFGMNVELDVERDIMQRDAEGHLVLDRSNPRQPVPQKQPGKVDAYRFMTFYLEPQTNHFEAFFNRVVDPVWLSQSTDPNAIALRQTQQVANKPACWRVMHRVTYVSRVLEAVPSRPHLSGLEQTLTTIDINSNYELIRQLDPLVRSHKDSYATLATAVHNALSRYLPELLPHEADVVQYLADYYGTVPG